MVLVDCRFAPVYDIHSRGKRVDVLGICKNFNAVNSKHIVALLLCLCRSLLDTCTFVNVNKVVRRCAETDLFRIVHYVRAMLSVDALDKWPTVISCDRLMVEYQIKASLVQSYGVKRSQYAYVVHLRRRRAAVAVAIDWKSHATLTLLAKQDCPLWLQYD